MLNAHTVAKICSGIVKDCHQHGVAAVVRAHGDDCKTCHIISLWSVPQGTCFLYALRNHCLMWRDFYQETLKSFSVAASGRHPASSVTDSSARFKKEKRKKAKENKRKLIRRAYLELFDVPWGDKAIRTREKCPGEGGVSASQTWWRGKVNHVFDTGSAKVICLRWQCWISVSLRMQPLFKSIRGLGLTVSGGRSPLLWGWGKFFFSLPKFFQSQSGDIVTSNFLFAAIIKGYENTWKKTPYLELRHSAEKESARWKKYELI